MENIVWTIIQHQPSDNHAALNKRATIIVFVTDYQQCYYFHISPDLNHNYITIENSLRCTQLPTTLSSRASNECSRRYHNNGEGLVLVESTDK